MTEKTRNNNRPIENRCGIEFYDYKFYLLSVVGDRDDCILAAENRGINLYDWYPDPHMDKGWNLIGVLPTSAPLDIWMAETDPNPPGGYRDGSLVIYWQLNETTGEIVK